MRRRKGPGRRPRRRPGRGPGRSIGQGRGTSPRPKHRQIHGRPLNPRLQRELRRANHLMSKGEHSNAANIFLSLAERARDLGIKEPASMLFLQAAHANILAGEIESAVKNAHTGLTMLADAENWLTLRHESERIIELMSTEGHQDKATEMKIWLKQNMEAVPGDVTPQPELASTLKLPEKCSYCGASMSLEQINAAGAKAAQCRYCGSVVLPSQSEQ